MRSHAGESGCWPFIIPSDSAGPALAADIEVAAYRDVVYVIIPLRDRSRCVALYQDGQAWPEFIRVLPKISAPIGHLQPVRI